METNEIKKDSLGKDAAWAKWEKGRNQIHLSHSILSGS